MTFDTAISYAQNLDKNDPIGPFRSQFHIPQKNQKDVIYLCGNSLGLQPKKARIYLEEELKDWETLAVEGHFIGRRPWSNYHTYSKKGLSNLLGTKTSEVVTMGSLTENLHLLLTAFYEPIGKRKKIMIEKMAFPSDHYAVLSQLEIHGFNNQDLIEIEPDFGVNFSTKHVTETIEKFQDELALILLPGIQYYSGQLFEIEKITLAAHKVGAVIGFDLAHAIGNVPMNLHQNMVDFATWCSYKYLNSGPGGISGIFVHEKHLTPKVKNHLKGWWGHDPETRFKMDNQWSPSVGVDAWQLSNPNILSAASNLAAIEVMEQATITALREKSKLLTGYLEFLLLNNTELSDQVKIITPSNPDERGAQLSLKVHQSSPKMINNLSEQGVILDYREPQVIRVAPVPLYNTYMDVWNFVKILADTLKV